MSTSSSQTKSYSGYAQKDVFKFLTSQDVAGAGKDLSVNTPSKVTTDIETKKEKNYLKGEGSIRQSGSGFMGEYSAITDEQLSQFAQAYKTRAESIKSRIAQPGRLQTII